MLPKLLIEHFARKRASDLFFENYYQQKPLKTKEEFHQLAQQEAERFYQTGTLLWLFKVSQLATRQAVTSTYIPSFTDRYELHTAQTDTPFDPEKGLHQTRGKPGYNDSNTPRT